MISRSVLIEVTDTRAIGSDTQQWTLMRRNLKTDKVTKSPSGGYSTWTSYGYHSKFGLAAAALEEELIRECGATTFTELSRLARQIHDQLKEIFTLAESYKGSPPKGE